MTQLSVLGSDGGIAKDCRTSCMLIDDDILIDAGTGLGDLSFDAMTKIDHIFLSHIHMDHIANLPLMIDTVLMSRQSPITIYAPIGDDKKLMQHIFNGVIWPDFTSIPSPDKPAIRVISLSNAPYEINGRRIGVLPVNHHGEAVGFWVEGGDGTLVFTGDTGPCEDFWQAVNALENVRYVVIECSFKNGQEDLAILTGHMTPSLVASELNHLKGKPEVFVTHMKPAGRIKIREEVSDLSSPHDIQILENGQIVNF